MKDTQIKKLIEAEKKRQKKAVNLIASENYVSKDVLEALGSELTNKYAEGYPGKRYYGGNGIIDKVEDLCKERALNLFKLDPKEWHVNVQPLSGSPANLAVYVALMQPTIVGNQSPSSKLQAPSFKIMGMSLDHGGHLTHGHKVSASGKFWQQIPYGIDPVTEVLNYDQLMEQAMNEKPAIIVAGYTAYPRIIDWSKMRNIADASGCIAHGGHVACGWTGRRRSISFAVPIRGHRHHDHAQDAPRSALGIDLRQEGCSRARQEDRQGGIPGLAGRSAHESDRGGRGRSQRSGFTGLQEVCRASRQECQSPSQ